MCAIIKLLFIIRMVTSISKKLDIVIDENRRKRLNFEKVLYKLPGLINEKYNFKSISEKTVNIINNQTTDNEISQKIEKVDLFQKDVKMGIFIIYLK